MPHLFLLVCTVFSVVLADTYIQQNYTARPLTRRENEQLQETCGRKQYTLVPNRFRHHKVLNGDDSSRDDAPWIVSVLRVTRWKPSLTIKQMYNSPTTLLCTGNLISSRHVLTAAKCVDRSAIHRLLFVFHKQCDESKSKGCNEQPILIRRSVKGFRAIRFAEVEEESNIPATFGNVGIYELTEDVHIDNSIYPVCLGDYELTSVESTDFYGYDNNHKRNTRHHLSHVALDVADCDLSNDEQSSEYYWDMLCTYNKYKKLCSEDIGGGLVHSHRGVKSITAIAGNDVSCNDIDRRQVYGKDSERNAMTKLQPHLYWICEATGVCPNKEIEDDVALWTSLPNRKRERYQTVSAVNEFDIYVRN